MLHLGWLRRFIRRHTHRIPEDRAFKWNRRLLWTYRFCVWNAVGAILYMMATGRGDWMKAGGYKPDVDVPPARSWAHILGVKNAKVISVSGLSVTNTYEIREGDGWDYENPLNNIKPKDGENEEPVPTEELE